MLTRDISDIAISISPDPTANARQILFKTLPTRAAGCASLST
jgi:hypothetical protein